MYNKLLSDVYYVVIECILRLYSMYIMIVPNVYDYVIPNIYCGFT